MQRVFIPGSEWLYFKIYTGCKSADIILIDAIFPMIEYLKENNLIDHFFFIRYGDPKFHVRLRLHINDVINYGSVFNCFEQVFKPYVDNGIIWNIQCDTYKRELERYGTTHIDVIEKIFNIDSIAVIKFIKLTRDSDLPDDDRWKLSLLMIDDLLDVFGLDVGAKFKLMKDMSNNYRREFNLISSDQTKQLNDKFRLNRKDINSVMMRQSETMSIYNDILTKRKNNIAELVKDIDYDEKTTNDLLYNLNHMTTNRLFRTKGRVYELVVYDFIQRYYDSVIARRKYK